MADDSQQADREARRRQLSSSLDRLQEMQRTSEGSTILGHSRSLEASYRVLRGNHADLKFFLDHIGSPSVDAHMWAEKHRYRLKHAEREVARLLHNFVAAVMSLADVTRHMVVDKRYFGTNLLDDYNERKDRTFANAPLHQFMQKLRVYTLHLQLPTVTPVSHRKLREDGGFDSDNTFWLDVDRLREWDGWNDLARQYLQTLDSKARLTDIIDEYEPVVTGFHKWLSERIREEHAGAINDLADLEARMREVEREWLSLSDNPEAVGRETLPKRDPVTLDEVFSPETRSDFATIDDLVSTLYASVSFPPGGLPNLDRFRSLFFPDAQFIHVEPSGSYLSNVGKYIGEFHVALSEGKITAVTETEIARSTLALGDVAHVLSFHKEHSIEDGEEKNEQGLYDLHLVKAGDRWAVTSMHMCHGYEVELMRALGYFTDQSAAQRRGEAP